MKKAWDTQRVKIERKRIDTLKKLVVATRTSLWNLYDQFANAQLDVRVLMRVLGIMMANLRRLSFEVTEIDHVYNAVTAMMNGKLSHFILPTEQLENSLHWLQRYLEDHHSNLHLLHTDAAYYYRHAKSHVYKQDRHLVINVEVPLTIRELLFDLQVYRVRPVPLSSPDGDARHHTRLHLNFQAVIYNVDSAYYAVVYDMQDLPDDTVINLQLLH